MSTNVTIDNPYTTTTTMEKGNNSTEMDEKTNNYLFQMAMKSQWEEVVQIYRQHPWAHHVKITKSGDTALHIAVFDGQEEHVDKLVKLISKEVLQIRNDQGNTPLHVAASMGNVGMCLSLAKEHPSLVGEVNEENETPLFLAALYGKKDAFLYLHTICTTTPDYPQKQYKICRRKDGETILHCAIHGDYFDLAYQIIKLYGDLVNYVNVKGVSPLHLLATKPSAFKSGSHLSGTGKIIYYCLYVDELKVERLDRFDEGLINAFEKKEISGPKYPENYETCMKFIMLFQKMICAATYGRGIKSEDTENPVKPPNKLAPNGGNSVTYGGGIKSEDNENPVGPNKLAPNQGILGSSQSTDEAQEHKSFPDNYKTCFELVKLLLKAMLIILGLGSLEITKIREKKKKNIWAVQIMNELLKHASTYKYEYSGMNPQDAAPSQRDNDETRPEFGLDYVGAPESDGEQIAANTKGNISKEKIEADQGSSENKAAIKRETQTPILIAAKTGVTEAVAKILELFPVAIQDMNTVFLAGSLENKTEIKRDTQTPILIAAKNGVTEMVEKILELFPVAIHDMNTEKKNIVLLAAENRHPDLYQFLLNRKILKENVFSKVDSEGNSALHLAAKFGKHKPWLIPGAALQMQWEIKWYEFVKASRPIHFFTRHNKEGKTAKEIFTETHVDLVKAGGEWLTSTSQSCSVVAALIATVAFATSTTVPGGIKEESGEPTLENQPAFDAFAIASLVALCFSVTSLVMFLSILTSRYQERDFGKDLPRKLLAGLTSLFVSIASILVAFCAGHFFVLKDKLKYAAFPVYGITCLPVTFFAMAQFPLYVDLIWATIKKVPQRSYKIAPL